LLLVDFIISRLAYETKPNNKTKELKRLLKLYSSSISAS